MRVAVRDQCSVHLPQQPAAARGLCNPRVVLVAPGFTYRAENIAVPRCSLWVSSILGDLKETIVVEERASSTKPLIDPRLFPSLARTTPLLLSPLKHSLPEEEMEFMGMGHLEQTY